MQDKQVPCRIAGCEHTWTWFAAQQIRGFGQPPPDRMCEEHMGQFNELADREVPCRTPGCSNTWAWKRGAQLAEMQRTGKLRRPSRLCAECFNAERETHDVELPCKIDGCRRSWTWTRDAQLRHRLWVLRQRAKADAAAARVGRPREEQDGRGIGEGEREGRRARELTGEAQTDAVNADREGGEVRTDAAASGEGRRGRGRGRGRGGENGEAPRMRNREGRDPTIDFAVTVERALPFLEGESGAGSDVAVSEDMSARAGREGRGSEASEAAAAVIFVETADAAVREGAGAQADVREDGGAQADDREGVRDGDAGAADANEGVREGAREADAREQTDEQADASEADAHEADASEADAGEADASEADASEADASERTREGEDGESHEPGEGGERRKRRRKRRRGGKPAPNPEGPPERMCGLCAQKISRVQAKEQPCKVHGCSRTWTWDRASQMRAWVLSGSDDVDFEPAAPRRMCEVCREFCRTHPDREVPCGRPGCANTWMFKTGAQLPAFLAGRLADPLKLCGECSRGEFAATFRPGGEAGAVPEGAETMPCVIPGCEGTWLYIPGMRLQETSEGELSPDRMCDAHRAERGLSSAGHPETHEVEVTEADLAVDEVDETHEADEAHEAEVDLHEDAAGEAPAESESESEGEAEAEAEAEEPEPAA